MVAIIQPYRNVREDRILGKLSEKIITKINIIMSIITKKLVDDLSYKIIGAAIEVHKHLGAGLLEKVYEKCLIYELKNRGFIVETQQSIYVEYKGEIIDCELRYDLLVEKMIVVELKATTTMIPLFDAQLMSWVQSQNDTQRQNIYCSNGQSKKTIQLHCAKTNSFWVALHFLLSIFSFLIIADSCDFSASVRP